MFDKWRYRLSGKTLSDFNYDNNIFGIPELKDASTVYQLLCEISKDIDPINALLLLNINLIIGKENQIFDIVAKLLSDNIIQIRLNIARKSFTPAEILLRACADMCKHNKNFNEIFKIMKKLYGIEDALFIFVNHVFKRFDIDIQIDDKSLVKPFVDLSLYDNYKVGIHAFILMEKKIIDNECVLFTQTIETTI